MTKYYRWADNTYVGGFDGVPPPPGAIEVPIAPSDARQVWTGANWGPLPPPPLFGKVTDAWRTTVTITGTATTATVTFPVLAPNADYSVLSAVNAFTGAPPTGAFVSAVTNLTTAGFTVRLAAAPGPGVSVTVTCIVLKVG